MSLRLLLLTGCLSGCVMDRTGQSSTEAYRRELATQAARIDTLNAAADKADARLSQLEELTRARGQDEIMKMENLDQLRQEVSNLRGDLEILSHNYDQGSKDGVAQNADAQYRIAWLETRAEQLERSMGLKTPPPPAATAATAATAAGTPPDASTAQPEPPATPEVEAPSDPASLLKLAEDHLAGGREEAAEAVLKRLLKEFPNDPLVPEARYRIGEAKFNAKDYPAAVLAFQAVIDAHRDSPWASWAMLRQGECFEAQGQAKNAKLFYDDTIRLYPKSKAAKEAKEKLGK